MIRLLSKHPLIADAMVGLRPSLDSLVPQLLMRVRKTGSLRARKPTPPKSAVEQFHYRIFSYASRVATDFDTLEKIISMVRRIPTKRSLKKWGFTGDKWLEYQYTMYLVTLVGSVDRCLLVVNAVLNLGLAPQDCTDRILLRHSRIKGTKIESAIKKLLSEVKQLRSYRNLDVHQKDLPPFYKILGVEEYDWLPILALVGEDDETLVPPEWLQKGFRYAGQLLASQMLKGRTKLKNRIWRVFDLLVPIARREIAVLSLLGK